MKPRVDSAKSGRQMAQNINMSSARPGEELLTEDGVLENQLA